MSIHTILVPTDLSAASEAAVAFAADLAHRQGARITLLHVVEALPGSASLGAAEEEREMERRALHATATLDRIREGLPPGSDFEVVRGTPGPTILDAADRRKPEMIVMSTHGRRGLARVVMGSVAEFVLRRAPCPVTCVPPAAVTATTG